MLNTEGAKIVKTRLSSITFELKKQNIFLFATLDKMISFENSITDKI
jgi:hypothetical protein